MHHPCFTQSLKHVLLFCCFGVNIFCFECGSEFTIQEECSALLQTRYDRQGAELDRSDHLDDISKSFAEIVSNIDSSDTFSSSQSKGRELTYHMLQSDDEFRSPGLSSETGPKDRSLDNQHTDLKDPSRNMSPLSMQQLEMYSTEELVEKLLDVPPPSSNAENKHGIDTLKQDPFEEKLLDSYGLNPEAPIAATHETALHPIKETAQDPTESLKQAANGSEVIAANKTHPNSKLDADLMEEMVRIATVNHLLPFTVASLLWLVLLTMSWVCLFLACYHTNKHYQRRVYGHGWDQA